MYAIRRMKTHDIDAAVSIDDAAGVEPWTYREFFSELGLGDGRGIACEDGRTLVGYLVYSVLGNSILIHRVAVAPRHRRRGVGRKLIQSLMGKLRSMRQRRITIVVRDTELPTHLFFKAMGFVATATLRGHFDRPVADGYLFDFCKAELSSKPKASRSRGGKRES